jgi:hypothetical protein
MCEVSPSACTDVDYTEALLNRRDHRMQEIASQGFHPQVVEIESTQVRKATKFLITFTYRVDASALRFNG